MNIDRFSRRNFLLGAGAAGFGLPGLAAASSTAKPSSRLDRLVRDIRPELEIINAHTKEHLRLRYYSVTGYDPDAVEKLNWIMRDWRQKETIQMDARLFWALSAIRMAAMKDGHSGVMYLLSGYRSKKTNAMLSKRLEGVAWNSLHIKGMAADITMEGVKIKSLADYAEWLQIGGVGSYNRSNFIHIDSGRERRWG